MTEPQVTTSRFRTLVRYREEIRDKGLELATAPLDEIIAYAEAEHAAREAAEAERVALQTELNAIKSGRRTAAASVEAAVIALRAKLDRANEIVTAAVQSETEGIRDPAWFDAVKDLADLLDSQSPAGRHVSQDISVEHGHGGVCCCATENCRRPECTCEHGAVFPHAMSADPESDWCDGPAPAGQEGEPT